MPAIVLFIIICLFTRSKSQPNSPQLQLNLQETEKSGPSFGREYEYAVIIDAGSTGSRVHVYRYTRQPSGMLIDVDFASHQYKKFNPGLSSFQEQTLKRSKITQYLSPLVNYAREYVPHYVRPRTPLYLLATAGMRKLREENNTLASMIMRMCAEELQNSEFLVKKDWVRIIDGKHEGVWSWITANYLNGEIQKGVTMGSPFQAQTRGVLEMGGESLQISYVPTEQQLPYIPAEFLTRIEIGTVTFTVFTHSYMGLGMQAAQERLGNQSNENEQNRCCLNRSQDNEKDSNNNKKKEKENHGKQTGLNLLLEKNEEKTKKEERGDFEHCYESLIGLLNVTNECRWDKDKYIPTDLFTCSPYGVPIPKIFDHHPFYWIENFYYIAQILQIETTPPSHFLSVLKERGKLFCAMDNASAITNFPVIASHDVPKRICFSAAWLSVIIDHGFNLRDFTNYLVLRDINSIGLDWALGFLVEHFKQIPTPTPPLLVRPVELRYFHTKTSCGCAFSHSCSCEKDSLSHSNPSSSSQ